MAGERTNVSDEVIREAARSIDLREDFFDAPGPIELDSRDFLGPPGVDGWEAWLAGEGASATQSERDVVRAMAAAASERGEVVTPQLLSGMLLALRMHRAASTTP